LLCPFIQEAEEGSGVFKGVADDDISRKEDILIVI
jgi:hypothetical protein